MRRLVDEAAVDVSQGSSATVSLDAAKRLEVSPQPPPPPANWRQTFEQKPPAIWEGQWVPADAAGPGRLLSVPDFSYRRANGTPVAAYVIAARAGPKTVASVSPDSVLRVRFRIKPGSGVVALVGMYSIPRAASPALQTMIDPRKFQADSSGWRTWQSPLSASM